jgi:hypothetical protein
MTIIAGFSSSRQGTAPLNLAAQIARSSGDKIIATAIVERPWPPKGGRTSDTSLPRLGGVQDLRHVPVPAMIVPRQAVSA